MNEKEKENDTSVPQPEQEGLTTEDLTPLPMGTFPSLPDSHPLFQRGFVIGGRGFNRPRPQKNSR
ncbi:MAG: hypothetical protein CMN03_08505 [Roseibacillus sp.]|nr:hypothetical protein [Roseibacillus sp.]